MIEYSEYTVPTDQQNVLMITVCTDQVGLIAAIQRTVRRHKRYQNQIADSIARRRIKR